MGMKNRFLLSRMNEPPIKRKPYLKQIRMAVRGTREAVHEYQPKRTLIELSSGRQVYITFIGLENMVKDMLSNTTLMNPDNILWGHEESDSLSEVNTGHWWSVASRTECRTPSEVLWPLTLFIDGMKISNLGTLRLEPVTFTFLDLSVISDTKEMHGVQQPLLKRHVKCDMVTNFLLKRNFKIIMIFYGSFFLICQIYREEVLLGILQITVVNYRIVELY
jgi:hypothetical protein